MAMVLVLQRHKGKGEEALVHMVYRMSGPGRDDIFPYTGQETIKSSVGVGRMRNKQDLSRQKGVTLPAILGSLRSRSQIKDSSASWVFGR